MLLATKKLLFLSCVMLQRTEDHNDINYSPFHDVSFTFAFVVCWS